MKTRAMFRRGSLNIRRGGLGARDRYTARHPSAGTTPIRSGLNAPPPPFPLTRDPQWLVTTSMDRGRWLTGMPSMLGGRWMDCRPIRPRNFLRMGIMLPCWAIG